MINADPRNPKGIVWIASYPKSGNTWMRMFIYQLMRIMGGEPDVVPLGVDYLRAGCLGFAPLMALYAVNGGPRSWHDADWSSIGSLPPSVRSRTVW